MPLSPHEEKALAALEEGLRADDPTFAAVLDVAPSSARSSLHRSVPLRTAYVLLLLAALGAVIAAGTLLGDRPAALAVVTAALVLPWVVGAALAAARQSDPTVPVRRRAGGRLRGKARPIGYGAAAVAVVLLLVGLAVFTPTERALAGLAITFVVAPLAAVRVMTWMDRDKPR